MALFSLQDVSFAYPKGPSVFEHLHLDIEEGEMVGILGPNGCGKSTLFDIMTRHHRIKSGSIQYRGKNLAKSSFFDEVGCVFQSVSLDSYLTVHENLWMQGSLLGIARKLLRQRIQDNAAQFQFEQYLDTQVRFLSGGYARRVEIAKALIGQPKFILLDEPSTGLDPKSRLDLFAWVERTCTGKDRTVVWISHLIEEVQKMDRVIMLYDGNIVCDGNPAELVHSLGHVYVHATLKNHDVVEHLQQNAEDIALQGDQLTFRIDKKHAQEMVSALTGHVESLTYREANLEDVYLEKTGERFQ